MDPEERRAILLRCARFLRETAAELENAKLGEGDPVGVVVFTPAGPVLLVPREFVSDTSERIAGGFHLRGYGDAPPCPKN